MAGLLVTSRVGFRSLWLVALRVRLLLRLSFCCYLIVCLFIVFVWWRSLVYLFVCAHVFGYMSASTVSSYVSLCVRALISSSGLFVCVRCSCLFKCLSLGRPSCV